MAKMLKHKETGELFIYTPLLAQNSFLELVVEDPVATVIDELKKTEPPASEPPANAVVGSDSEAQVVKTAQTTKVRKSKSAIDADMAAALE